MAKTPYDHPKPDVPKPDAFGVSSRGADKTPQIRHTKPEVARHCARLILACNMDAEAAVAKMLATDYPDASDAQIIALARTIQASPYVQREMTALLEEIGFGDEALRKLIGLLWQEALGTNDKRWASAVRLLAEITSAHTAKQQGAALPTLRLGGMDDGLAKMLGPHAPTNDASNTYVPKETDIMDEEDEGNEDGDGESRDS